MTTMQITGSAAAAFGRTLRAEWTKLRSVRSTIWSLVIMAVVTVGFTAIATGFYAGSWDSMDAADQARLLSDPIGLILQPGAYYGQIALCVLGVMVVAGEYSTGTISASLLAVPARTPVLAAKAAVLAAVVFVAGEVIAFASFLLGSGIVSRRVDVSLDQPGVLRAVLGLGLYLPTVALLALAVGAIIRHVAGAITAVLAIVVVLPSLASLLPGDAGRYASTLAPGGSAGPLLLSSGTNPDAVLTPWQGFAVACAWSIALLAVAAMLLRRRDA
ncbi:ABC transporter permease [Actinoplanes sp. NPDC026623]|uniref:ABC transporter permease n=1 Tax=Actinoplanes sp. NPDC026623 TaxID=3155610 RepID=UPI0033D557CE